MANPSGTSNDNGNDNDNGTSNASIKAPPNSRKGKLNFSLEEKNAMLNVMAEILPIDAKEWGQVMERTQEKTGIERTAPSLKRKFQTLHRKKIQTGNSNMPEEVLAAKRIFHKIRQRALVSVVVPILA